MSLLTLGGTSKVLFPERGRSWAVPPLPPAVESSPFSPPNHSSEQNQTLYKHHFLLCQMPTVKLKENRVKWADVSGCSALLNSPEAPRLTCLTWEPSLSCVSSRQLYRQAIHINHPYETETSDAKLLKAWAPDWLLPTAHAATSGVPTHLCWHRSGNVNCLNDDLSHFHLCQENRWASWHYPALSETPAHIRSLGHTRVTSGTPHSAKRPAVTRGRDTLLSGTIPNDGVALVCDRTQPWAGKCDINLRNTK